jgi:hypothetical protein
LICTPRRGRRFGLGSRLVKKFMLVIEGGKPGVGGANP